MNLFDICSGIEWNTKGKFEFHSSNDQNTLLIEYLSIFKNSANLSIEYKKLVSFQEKLHKNPEGIEQFIQNELFGFIEIAGRIYAFIGGSMDFTVRLLFDLEKNKLGYNPFMVQ